MLHLTDLHDASLDSVTIGVAANTVVFELVPIQFEGAPKRVTLTATAWRAFSCSKRDPWGSAATWYVNEARGPFDNEAGLQHLELEMQSGDVIEIDAESFARIDEAPGHAG